MTAALWAGLVRTSAEAPIRLSCSEWANQYGWVARGSGGALPGRYSTALVPYMTAILDVMGDEEHPDVVFNKPSQVGFTEALNQFVGYCMSADPSGVLVIRESDGAAKDWMKERIDPMVAESPALRGRIRSEGGRRTSDDTLRRKVFVGGWLVAVGANAPGNMRSRPARRVLGDERSMWTLDARNQGDPWDLAAERTTTFWNAKRIQGSTPGEDGTCPITDALRASDWRRYHVPCPACGVMEPLAWKSVDGVYRLVCETDAGNAPVPASARYLCTSCGALIPETEKARMLRRGRWVAAHPEKATVGFDLNALYSPFPGSSWAKIMEKWLVASTARDERLKTFVTHILAEPWQDRTERLNPVTLRARAETITDPPARLRTFSVDVQADRLESLVVAFGQGEEQWVLDYQQHWGDPSRDEVWRECAAHLKALPGAPMRAGAIDGQYLPDRAWQGSLLLQRTFPGCRVVVVQGMDGAGKAVIQQPGATRSRTQRPKWLVGVRTAKDTLLLHRLPIPVPPGGIGAIHFADTIDPGFFDQLAAEHRVTIVESGRQVKAWRKRGDDLRNEGLDLLVYAFAALYSLGPRYVLSLAKPLASAVAIAAPTTASEEPMSEPTEDEPSIGLRRRGPRRSTWVYGGWR